jgi:hypothetical protein
VSYVPVCTRTFKKFRKRYISTKKCTGPYRNEINQPSSQTSQFSKQYKPQTTASMNFFLFAPLSLLIIASSVEARKEWSGNVQMQIKRQAGATAQCSDQAMQTLNENVSDFLQDELVNLIGTEDAFSIGDIRGSTHGDNLSLITSFDCLDCGTIPDNRSMAQILMFFMQRRKDAWLPESDSAVTGECVDYDASVSSIVVVETVASIPTTQPVAFVDTYATKNFSARTCTSA